MTRPFSDGGAQPEIVPTSPSARGGPERLRSDREQWQRRASVAAEATEQLDTAVASLKGVTEYNYFGECREGRQFRTSLTSALAMLSDELTGFADRTHVLSQQCREAADRLDEADQAGARSIEG